MLKERYGIVAIYVCITIIFLNFGINIISDYQLTIAFLYPVLFGLLFKIKYNRNIFILYLFSTFIPIITFLIGVLVSHKIEFISFIRSYALYFHFCFSMFIVWNIKIDNRFSKVIDRGVFFALLIVGTYTILQVVVSEIKGKPSFYNPFGEYLIGGVSNPGRFWLNGRIRPTTFYWEPSTNALIILVLINYLVIRNIKKFKKYYFFHFIFQFLINSTTGLFAAILSFMVWINNMWKRYTAIKYIAIFCLIFVFVIINITRLRGIFIAGSSGNYRWVVPVKYYFNYILTFPLGLPLGNLFYPIDNGIFVALIYTGVIGGVIGVIYLLHFLNLIVINRISIETQLTVITVLLIMIFNGAFLTPEMSFLISLILIAFKGNRILVSSHKE